jgi:hypothetical protein
MYGNRQTNNWRNNSGIESILNTLNPGTTVVVWFQGGVSVRANFSNYDPERNLAFFIFPDNDPSRVKTIAIEASRITMIRRGEGI